jgi:methionyl-tRNA synthetase
VLRRAARPNRFFAQGFITKNGKRLSKTTGNVIDPWPWWGRTVPTRFRYFLLREGTYGQDWDFTDQAFVTRFNADLANDLGNLASRALTMVRNYCQGKVPPPAANESPAIAVAAIEDVLDRYEALDFGGALTEVWKHVGAANQAIVTAAPWNLAKEPARRGELEGFLYRLIESVRLIAVLVSPVMPRAAGRILGMLGIKDAERGPGDLLWGD